MQYLAALVAASLLFTAPKPDKLPSKVPAPVSEVTSLPKGDRDRLEAFAKVCKKDPLGRIWCHKYADDFDRKKATGKLGQNDPLWAAPSWFELSAECRQEAGPAHVLDDCEKLELLRQLPDEALKLGRDLLIKAVLVERVSGGAVFQRLPCRLHEQEPGLCGKFEISGIPDSVYSENGLRCPIEIRKVYPSICEGDGKWQTQRGYWSFHRAFKEVVTPSYTDADLKPVTADDVVAAIRQHHLAGLPVFEKRLQGTAWKWDLRWDPIVLPPARSAPAPSVPEKRS